MHSHKIIFVMFLMLMMLPLAPISASDYVGELHVEWRKFLPGISGESVVQTSDGGFLVLGTNATPVKDEDRYWYVNTTYLLVKTDADGNLLWTKTLPLNDEESLHTIIETSDGGYALGGAKYMIATRDEDLLYMYPPGEASLPHLFLVKVDSLGNIQWSEAYQPYAYLKSLIQTSDGGFALAGTRGNSKRGYKISFAKTDSSGNLEWSGTLYEERRAGVADIIQTDDGGYVTLGSHSQMVWLDATCGKIDADGNTVWFKADLLTANLRVYSGVATTDGGYLLGGEMRPDSGGDYFGLLAKIDANGNPVWDRTYFGQSSEILSVAQTADCGYIFVAVTRRDNADTDNAVVCKVDSEGNIQDQIAIGLANYYDYPSQIIVADDGEYVLVGTLQKDPYREADQKSYLIKIDSTIHPPNYAIIATTVVLAIAGATFLIYYTKIRKQRNTISE